MRALLLTLALLPFAVPVGAADLPACADVTEPYPMVGSTYYVPNTDFKALDLYRENHELDGLQRTDCVGPAGPVRADEYEQRVGLGGGTLCPGGVCVL